MLYKLFTIAVILVANIHYNNADTSSRSLLNVQLPENTPSGISVLAEGAEIPAASETPATETSATDVDKLETDTDTTDDNGDDEAATLNDHDNDADNDLDDEATDDTDLTDDTDGTDDNDDNDDGTDDGDDTADLDNDIATTDSGDSIETTDGSASSDDSLSDSIETTDASDSSANTDSPSVDSDSDSASVDDDDTTVIDGDDDDNSADADSEEIDECIGLTENDCDALTDDDGDRECAFNSVTSDCYGIERREGKYGRGNFDDGYNAARVKSTDDMEALNTIVACLGAIVGILLIVLVAGMWFMYAQNDGLKKVDFEHEKERVNTHDYDVEDDDLEAIDVDEVMVDVIEDVSPNVTGGATATGDRDPMLV